jgi:hypothetical protein
MTYVKPCLIRQDPSTLESNPRITEVYLNSSFFLPSDLYSARSEKSTLIIVKINLLFDIDD